MKPFQTLLLAALILTAFSPAAARESREEKQAGLDGTCEAARLKKLAPIKKNMVENCVANKELPSRSECVTFYADYGNRMGRRAPLFYDLPECVTAFEYNQSSRTSD